MCSRFEPVTHRVTLKEHFGVEVDFSADPRDAWPGTPAPFIRNGDAGREARLGAFGLIPRWAKDSKITRSTYNARSETVGTKPSFRDAWRKAQHCIIPATAFYEPDWRSGKAQPARISRADGRPLGIAGLWDCWQPAGAAPVYSFTMLTINADQHELMRQFHKPADEKRMVVILPEARYGDWLAAGTEDSPDFMQAFAAEGLHYALPMQTTPPRSAPGSLNLFDAP